MPSSSSGMFSEMASMGASRGRREGSVARGPQTSTAVPGRPATRRERAGPVAVADGRRPGPRRRGGRSAVRPVGGAVVRERRLADRGSWSGRQITRGRGLRGGTVHDATDGGGPQRFPCAGVDDLLQERVAELEGVLAVLGDADAVGIVDEGLDRKSTRLNSSHVAISYAVVQHVGVGPALLEGGHAG